MNLITEQIALPERYSLTPTAEQTRDLMIASAQMVTQVTNPIEQAAASLQGVTLQAHIKEVKSARLELAKPLNDACDKLITLEKDYLAPLQAEKDRLGRLVTVYQIEEDARIKREEAARAAEIVRLEAIRLEAEAKAGRARSEAGQLRAELVAHEASTAVQEVIRAPLPKPVKARGSATRRELRYVVIDVKSLYQARPELCALTERPSAIKAVCCPAEDANAVNPDKSIPGLSMWYESTTNFRS